MERKILNQLRKWAVSGDERLPILIYGARQVGKTYVMKTLGREQFDNTIYINFENDAMSYELFAGKMEPQYVISNIERYFGVRVIPYQTLIIFDEIQACENALTALKYFAEDAPEYHVIAAGSLLGVALNRGKYSFPVGKVNVLNMYPMDFEEFLWAKGEQFLADKIREHYDNNQSMNEAMHQYALQLYHEYIRVGGMPAVVYSDIEKMSVMNPIEIQELLLAAYVGDMSKYADNMEVIRTQGAFESLVVQLGKDNKKFQYKLIKSGARASQYGDSIDWLIKAGIVLQCTKCEQGLMPPSAYRDLSSFKLYFSDVGLLFKKSNMEFNKMIQGEHNIFKGALVENYVAQALKSNGYELLYWESGNSAEVDFIIVKDGEVIPIECKAGLHIRAKSLQVYQSKYNPPYAIRLSMRNFGMMDGIKSVPLYAVFCV